MSFFDDRDARAQRGESSSIGFFQFWGFIAAIALAVFVVMGIAQFLSWLF